MRALILCILILMTAALPTTTIAGYDYLWCNNADEIIAVPDWGAGDVTFYHKAAIYNCCCEPATFTLAIEEQTLTITETVEELIPCDCDCCFDFDVTVAGLAPGLWTVVYTWFDRETGGPMERVLTVEVPDVGGGDSPLVALAHSSDCLASSTVPMDDFQDLSWGTLKGRYR